tara:strand:- start:1849 stop:2292 length:444 start_codon:yes stop_codon:yes gene_type:complete
MENITNITNVTEALSSDGIFDCEDITNNGLYMIFIGYVYPLLSPTIRNYMKDMIIHVKNVGKVTGEIVSLTEFGFSKVQKIENIEDMAKFIERVSKNKNLSIMKDDFIECAKSYAGGESHNEGSWNSLLKQLEKLHKKNIDNKLRNP